MRNAYIVVIGMKGRDHLGHLGTDNRKEVGCEGADWINTAHVKCPMAGLL
jgi:hypothetical protein